MNYEPDIRPVAEGDDFCDESPLRAILFGSDFVALDDSEAMGISASGPNCVRTLAEALQRAGFGSDRELVLYRAGQMISRLTIGEAMKID
jgi:hypothetical protein